MFPQRRVLSAMLKTGYAQADWQRASYEQAMVDRLFDRLKKTLSEAELTTSA